MAEDLKTTPLNALHGRLGARMVAFAGYSMPVQYAPGVMKEHQHTRAAAGLFDVSHMAVIDLFGPQAREFLDVRDMLEEIYHRHTGRPREQLRKDMERDYFMAPETAREYGLIDSVVEPRQTSRFGGAE